MLSLNKHLLRRLRQDKDYTREENSVTRTLCFANLSQKKRCCTPNVELKQLDPPHAIQAALLALSSSQSCVDRQSSQT